MVFQVSRVTGAKIVDDENFVPPIQKVICQVRADESAPACDQYSHEMKPNCRTELQYGTGVGPKRSSGSNPNICRASEKRRCIVLANFGLQRPRTVPFTFAPEHFTREVIRLLAGSYRLGDG